MQTHPKKIKNVPIENIHIGDVVLYDGKETTVGYNNMYYDDFMGVVLFGRAMCRIDQVLFPKFYKGKFVGYKSQ